MPARKDGKPRAKSGRELNAAERRVAVENLRRAGYKGVQIAAKLGISEQLVSNDLKEIRKEWSRDRLDGYQEEIDADFERTNFEIQVLWPKVEQGNLWAIDRLNALLAHRAKVTGQYDRRVNDGAEGQLAEILMRVTIDASEQTQEAERARTAEPEAIGSEAQTQAVQAVYAYRGPGDEDQADPGPGPEPVDPKLRLPSANDE